MRDKVRQSNTAFRHDKSVMLQRNKSEASCLLGLNITFKYFVCLKKKSVNNIGLSFNLKLFWTKVDIKSVIRLLT